MTHITTSASGKYARVRPIKLPPSPSSATQAPTAYRSWHVQTEAAARRPYAMRHPNFPTPAMPPSCPCHWPEYRYDDAPANRTLTDRPGHARACQDALRLRPAHAALFCEAGLRHVGPASRAGPTRADAAQPAIATIFPCACRAFLARQNRRACRSSTAFPPKGAPRPTFT
jgi:hypothetical protein